MQASASVLSKSTSLPSSSPGEGVGAFPPAPSLLHQPDLFDGDTIGIVAPVPLRAPQRGPEGLDTGDQARSEPKGTKAPKKRNNRFTFNWLHADKQLEMMKYCGQQVLRFVHKRIICNASIFIPTSCDVRTCQHCGKARTGRELARYSEGIGAFRHPALLTLTVQNVPNLDDLPEALEKLTKGFERLRRHKRWPKGAKGIWSLEVTWSEHKGFHPHIHAVCDLPWVDFGWLAEAWEKLTGAKAQPDVKRPKNDEQRANLPFEALKYVSKAWELPNDVLRGLLALLGKRKLINSFGGLRAKKEDKLASAACCPGCQVPLSQCGMNLERSVLTQGEADKLETWLKTEGHPTFRDWYYPDRDGDPDLPRECRAPLKEYNWRDAE